MPMKREIEHKRPVRKGKGTSPQDASTAATLDPAPQSPCPAALSPDEIAATARQLREEMYFNCDSESHRKLMRKIDSRRRKGLRDITIGSTELLHVDTFSPPDDIDYFGLEARRAIVHHHHHHQQQQHEPQEEDEEKEEKPGTSTSTSTSASTFHAPTQCLPLVEEQENGGSEKMLGSPKLHRRQLLCDEMRWQDLAQELLFWARGHLPLHLQHQPNLRILSSTLLSVIVSGCKLGVCTSGAAESTPVRSKLQVLLAALPVLKLLNLADNDIGPHGAATLASHLAANTTLEVLNLSGNKLLGISVVRGSVCGTLQWEPFQRLLEVLSVENTTLTQLSLANNRLGGVYAPMRTCVTGDIGGGSSSSAAGPVQVVPTRRSSSSRSTHATPAVTNMEEEGPVVSLDECYGVLTMQLLVNFLARNTSLCALDLSNNAFDVDGNSLGVHSLAQAARKHPRLESLCGIFAWSAGDCTSTSSSTSSSSGITKESIFENTKVTEKLFGSDVGNLNSLQHISQAASVLPGYKPGHSSARDILHRSAHGPLVSSDQPNLQRWVSEKVKYYFPKQKPRGSRDGELSIVEKRFSGRHLDAFSGVLIGLDRYHWAHITTFDLSDNPFFGDEGLQALVHNLQSNMHVKNNRITRLCLKHIGLTSMSVHLIMELITHIFPLVVELDVSDNFLGAWGLYGLLAHINMTQKMTTLRCLYVRNFGGFQDIDMIEASNGALSLQELVVELNILMPSLHELGALLL